VGKAPEMFRTVDISCPVLFLNMELKAMPKEEASVSSNMFKQRATAVAT
jgi:hypothetical protein